MVMWPALGSVVCRCLFRRQTVNRVVRPKTPLLLRHRTNCQRRSFTGTCARPAPINHLRLVLPARLAKSPLPDSFWQETSRTHSDVLSAFCLQKPYCYRDFCVFLSHCDANPVVVSRRAQEKRQPIGEAQAPSLCSKYVRHTF